MPPWIALCIPLESESAVGLLTHAGAQLAAFTIQRRGQPGDSLGRCPVDSKAVRAHGRHGQVHELPGLRVECRKIHESEIGPKGLMAAHSLIVVQEVPAAVENGFALIDFDPFHVVGRVTVHDIDAGGVDEPVRKLPLLP